MWFFLRERKFIIPYDTCSSNSSWQWVGIVIPLQAVFWPVFQASSKQPMGWNGSKAGDIADEQRHLSPRTHSAQLAELFTWDPLRFPRQKLPKHSRVSFYQLPCLKTKPRLITSHSNTRQPFLPSKKLGTFQVNRPGIGPPDMPCARHWLTRVAILNAAPFGPTDWPLENARRWSS